MAHDCSALACVGIAEMLSSLDLDTKDNACQQVKLGKARAIFFLRDLPEHVWRPMDMVHAAVSYIAALLLP